MNRYSLFFSSVYEKVRQWVYDKIGVSTAGAILGVVIAAIATAVASTVGLITIAKTQTVYNQQSSLPAAANTAMTNTVGTIYSSWSLFGVVILVLIGSLAIGAFGLFMGMRSR